MNSPLSSSSRPRRICRPCYLLHLLLLGWLTGAMPATQESGAQESGAEERPNILFCIADDWGWPHAGSYGDEVVRTPHFDRLAEEGVLFERAFVASPSCTPSRNAILTGQYHWRLGAGVNLWSWLDVEHPVYPLLLEEAGYHVGHWRKSWGPGRLALGGYEDQHPAGKSRKSFEAFLEKRPEGAPFCFWFGAYDPHRDYEAGTGAASGLDVDAIDVPGFYPDTPTVRSDIADYYFEVERFDSDVGKALALLESMGELERTIVVVTGDHGMPFPRCKTNLYDMGVRVPLVVRWGSELAEAARGQRCEAFVSLVDLAPTFLEAAGVAVPEVVQGSSLWPLVQSPDTFGSARERVVFGRERHTAGRPGGVGYPARGLRVEGLAYIRNLTPDRWPSGDPPTYMDCDPHNSRGKGVTKGEILALEDDPEGRIFYDLSFGKRPAEELYDLTRDPDQLVNLAAEPAWAERLAALREELDAALRAAGDPRALGEDPDFDSFPYFGGGVWKPAREEKK